MAMSIGNFTLLSHIEDYMMFDQAIGIRSSNSKEIKIPFQWGRTQIGRKMAETVSPRLMNGSTNIWTIMKARSVDFLPTMLGSHAQTISL